jgi:hypothetical protein
VAALKSHGIPEDDVQWLTGLRMPALITDRVPGTVTMPEDYVAANDPNSCVLDAAPDEYLPLYTGSALTKSRGLHIAQRLGRSGSSDGASCS